MLEFAYGNFLLNTISSINFTKKIKSMGFSMTVNSLRGKLFDAHDECLFEAAKNSKPQHQFCEIVARINTGFGAYFLCDLNLN